MARKQTGAEMTDMNNFSDRDILVRLDLGMTNVQSDITELKTHIGQVEQKLSDRITALERDADKRTGMFTGAKFLWGILTAMPVGVIAFLLGAK
jgi:hypothetical protein